MRKLFWEDPYLTTLKTKVALVEGNTIVPEETIAYSFAGGQESDKALFNGIEVISSHMQGPLIYYVLPDNHGLCVGDGLTIEIDWQRRYRLMRLHFCAELILEIVTQKYKFEKIGAHISEHKARIDFMADTNLSTLFEEILSEFNRIIDADLPIYKDYSDIENQRRYWKIDGFAQVPYGGTHVKSTKEVGYVTLRRDRPGKGKERIEIHLINS